MRRQLIHHRTGTRRPSDVGRDLAKTWHFHTCADRDCRVMYECYGCDDATKNGRCHACRGLRRPTWDLIRDPQPCCQGNCVLVTSKDQLVRYHLAGPGPWFQCKTCARCHGWPCNNPPERKP